MSRRTRRQVVEATGVVVLALLLALIVVSIVSLATRVNHGEDKNATLQRALDSSNQAVTALAQQVRSLGAVPVATPVPGAPGPAGANGAQGASGVHRPGRTSRRCRSGRVSWRAGSHRSDGSDRSHWPCRRDGSCWGDGRHRPGRSRRSFR